MNVLKISIILVVLLTIGIYVIRYCFDGNMILIISMTVIDIIATIIAVVLLIKEFKKK